MPVYRAHSVQAISFFRPTTGEVAQFDLIENQSLEVTVKPIQQIVQAGKKITVKQLVTLKVTVFDSGLSDMLRTWQDNYQLVEVVAAGEPNLQWYEDSYLRITNESKLADGLWKYTLEVEAVQVLGQKTIHMNQNLLAYLGWADANADGINDTFANISAIATSLTFSSGVQSFTTGASGITEFRRDIVLPVTGIELMLSNSFTVMNEPNADMRILFRDFANNTLTTFQPNIQGVGVSVGNVVIPATAYTLRVAIFYVSPSTAKTVSMRNPALTTNRKLTPGTSFMNY